MHSLQQKITFGYYLICTLIVLLSIGMFYQLHAMEQQILAGEQVASFVDTALEIRRFEKNYFLYDKPEDLRENIRYVLLAEALLQENGDLFATLQPTAPLAQLGDFLTRYRLRMAEYSQESNQESDRHRQLENRIRHNGKEIVTQVENLADSQRQLLRRFLEQQRQHITLAILSLLVVVIFFSRILARRVVQPLREMEKSLRAVADGSRDALRLPSHDREFLSLTRAFNHMLRELELRRRHMMRSEKLASLGTLLSSVAHELNNPLSNISTSCQILAEELEEPDIPYKKELLAQIDDQTDRARGIVYSLLDFSRDRPIQAENLLLAKVVDETIALVRGHWRKQVTIRTEIPAELSVNADKQSMQQILLNLLSNAKDAIGEEGWILIRAQEIRIEEQAELEISPLPSFQNCQVGGQAVEIEFRDNGHGIPPEILPRIFDPFFTTKEVGKGYGLGLFVVHELIDDLNGCIAVESTPEKGTAFHFRLPKGETVPTAPSGAT